MTNAQADEERTGFDDWLPVRAEYIAPGEYKIVTCGGLPLWYMEGASLSEWICERINAGVYDDATDAAFEQYLKTDPDVQRALKQAADARAPTIPDPGAVSGQEAFKATLDDLLDYIESGRPSDYAPWRDCDRREMIAILSQQLTPKEPQQ